VSNKKPVVNPKTLELGPVGADYEWPGVDPVTEKFSFLTHVRSFFNSPDFARKNAAFREGRPVPILPSVDEASLASVIDRLYEPARWRIPEDPFSDKRIIASFDAINRKSSPGWPLMTVPRFQTNQKLIDLIGQNNLVKLVRERLQTLRAGGRCDPVRIFIKREWHKLKKIVSRRERLIWSVALLDQLVDELLYGPSLRAELQNYERIPSKPGLSEFGGGMTRVFDQMEPEGEVHRFCETDKSAWDMTVPVWLSDLEFRARWRLCCNPDGDFQNLFFLRAKQLQCSRIVFSDGTLLEQQVPGIMRSGSKITISANSRYQVILKVLYCQMQCGGFEESKHRIFATGDDTIERVDGIRVAEYCEWLRSLGFVIKGEDIHELATLEGANYVGRTFVRHTAAGRQMVFKPTYWSKHLFSLRHMTPAVLPAALASQCSEYAFDDEHFPVLYQLLGRVCPDLIRPVLMRSREYWQQQIMGGPRVVLRSEYDDENPDLEEV
jgi:hypothetical protein